jgi:hypothetical protein
VRENESGGTVRKNEREEQQGRMRGRKREED